MFIKHKAHIKHVSKNNFRKVNDLFPYLLYVFEEIHNNNAILDNNQQNLFEFAMGQKGYGQEKEEIIEIFNKKYSFISISEGNSSDISYTEIAKKALQYKFPSKSKFEL